MNASPASGAQSVFIESVAPQLGFNRDALRKLLAADMRRLGDGAVAYKVDVTRFNRFFDALTCGIVQKASNQRLPTGYSLRHIYHAFRAAPGVSSSDPMERMLLEFYSGDPLASLEFGKIRALNASVYTAKLFGIPGFGSSITVVHQFYGSFRVTSMVTRLHAG